MDSREPSSEPPFDLPVVRIAYQELYEREVPDNGPEHRYVYYWPFAAPPIVGQRVVVTSEINPDGCHAVVTGLGSVEDANGVPLKTVVSLVPSEEVEKAQREGDPNAKAWIRWIAHMQDQGSFLDGGIPDMRRLRDEEDEAGLPD
ncbi:MAG: hypothetical protein WA942_17390 [Mycolicibacter sinensis]